VRLVDADGPALVLGSTQPPGVVDEEAAAAGGVAVVRRRSGGGAVLVGTGDVVWVDVYVPAGDGLWEADVGRATHWLGRAWADTLVALGVEAHWHDGPLVASPWSSLVCFAGLGPGEVLAGPAGGPAGGSHDRPSKVVGISQRRTRAGTLFQCAALLRWDPAVIVGVLSLDDRDRPRAAHDLEGLAAGLADLVVEGGPYGRGGRPTVAAVEDAFLARLSSL
jgi:lipoate-protein ligase A